MGPSQSASQAPRTSSQLKVRPLFLILDSGEGLASVEEGSCSGTTVSLASTSLARSSSARPPHVTSYTRTIAVDTDREPPVLRYTMDMATTNTPQLTRHLEAELTKVA